MSVFDSGPVLVDSQATMLAILDELSGEDALVWRGGIDVWGAEGELKRWRLQLNNDKADEPGGKVVVFVGEYLALAYGRLLKLSADEV